MQKKISLSNLYVHIVSVSFIRCSNHKEKQKIKRQHFISDAMSIEADDDANDDFV